MRPRCVGYVGKLKDWAARWAMWCPMEREEVAPGEGALRTWMAPLVS